MTQNQIYIVGWFAAAICLSWAAYSIYKQKTTKP